MGLRYRLMGCDMEREQIILKNVDVIDEMTEKAEAYLNEMYPYYDWDKWLEEAFENKEYPWCSDIVYELEGWRTINWILRQSGNEDAMDKFGYGEMPGK